MRTFNEILQEIVDKKNEQLPELDSTSLTAIWWIWANIVASAIYIFEQIVYKEKEDLEDYSRKQRFGTNTWWPQAMLDFQLGDPLVMDDETGIYSYAVIDPVKQIFQRAALIDDNTGGLLLKVAKEVAGELAPIDPGTELPGVISYVNEIAPAGVVVNVLSLNADEIGGTGTIYYDGNNTEADIKTAINDALIDYRNNITDQINFNGTVLKNALIDTIREVEGVDDVFFDTLYGKPDAGVEVYFDREYTPLSGYFNYPANWLDNDFTFEPRYQNALI